MNTKEKPMNDTAAKAERKNKEIVFQVIADLCEHNQGASRARIVELTHLKMTTVDEQVKRLKEDGRIRALFNGLFEPIDTTEDRPVSTTSMARGRMKLEVGDVVLDLTPRESLAIAKQFAGHLVAFRNG